jgi:FtsZ-interacting cell division protein ZipA
MVNTLLAKPINIKKNIFITLAVVSIMFGCSSDDSSISDTDVMKTSKEDGAVYIPKQKSIESTIESQNIKTTVQTKKSVEQPIAKPAPVKNNTTVPRQSNADSVPVVQTKTPATSLNNSTTLLATERA